MQYAGLTKRRYIDSLKTEFINERSTFEGHWRECAEFIKPRRSRFVQSDKGGDKRNGKIIDGTATLAADTFKSGFHANCSNPSQPWLRLTTPDPELAEYGPVKHWLHVVTQRMLAVFHTSNLYDVLPTIYLDAAVFGTAAVGILEDDEEVIRAYSYPIGSYYVGSDSRGVTAHWMLERTVTVLQLVEQFGLDNVSERVRVAYQGGKYSQAVEACWYIGKNQEADPRRIGGKYLPFTSCWYEKAGTGDDKFLSEEGYREFPILVPKWARTDALDNYASEWPAALALGDIKQLQTGEKRGAQALEKELNPPLQMPVSLRNTTVSLLPAGATFLDRTADAQGGIRPIHEIRNFGIDKLEFKQQQVRSRIERYFFADLFRMISNLAESGTEKTVPEIAHLAEEQMWGLAPLMERMNVDLFDPLVDRTYAIMDRREMIPPAPKELAGVDLKVEYVSRLAQSLKLVTASGHERFLGTTANLMATFPQIKHKIDIEQAVDDLGDMYGVNPKWIRGDEEAAKLAAQEAQVIQAQQQLAAIESGSKSARNLASSPTEGKNALTDLVNA